MLYNYERYAYQVAIASLNGYTVPAQKFAATYRIPLLEFDRLPFWNEFCEMLGYRNLAINQQRINDRYYDQDITDEHIINLANRVGQRMAVAITNSGQMLFLYRESGEENQFDDYYSLCWTAPNHPWKLRSGDYSYLFQLPKDIMKLWLNNASNELEMKKEAINCKATFSQILSYIIVNFVVRLSK